MNSRSALIEIQNEYWNIHDVHYEKTTPNVWMTLLIQNRLKIDLSITPLKSRDWKWNKNANKINLHFLSNHCYSSY